MITVRIYNDLDTRVLDELETYLDYFACDIEFVRRRFAEEKKNKLIIQSIDSLKAGLFKIYDFILFLEQNEFEVEFQNEPFGLESSEFISLLKQFGAREKMIFKKQIAIGIERARDQGKSIGRPKISDEKITQIKKLHKQKKTLREIAIILDVSLGTVHKYTTDS